MEESTEPSFEERSRIYTRHKAGQMIAAIDELRAGVQRCIESEQHWREVAHRSKEEVAREIQNEYSEENRRIRDELRFSIASLSSELELTRYNAFCKAHDPCRLRSRSDGGKMPYVIQVGTGVGVATKVFCQVCGASEDITDTSVW